MGKIKNQVSNIKIDGKHDSNQGCCSEQYPWFSFRALTNNSKYNLEGIPSGSDREKTLWGLNLRLIELSSKPWIYWTQQPKKIGLETIAYGELNFSAGSEMQLTKDTTLYVFRFDTNQGNGRGRIIGYKESPCSVLHIIGYDLDFTAYDHGH